MKKLLAILTLSLLSLSLYNRDNDLPIKFNNYAEKFNKRYSSNEERIFRYSIYENNVKILEKHNQDNKFAYSLGETQFSDWTQEEFQETYLTFIPQSHDISAFVPNNIADQAVDWKKVTDVKEQGQCGSSWAFSAIGAIESVVRIYGQGTENLSEQQLVDCDTQSYGCSGGWPDLAIKWSIKFGNNLGRDYPYTARDQSCKLKTGTRLVSGVKSVASQDLQIAVTRQPVSVAVDATNWSQYKGGVFSNCEKNINHPVLAVGYEEDGTWILKGQWGTSWGESGFIRLASGDTCGVTQLAVIAEL